MHNSSSARVVLSLLLACLMFAAATPVVSLADGNTQGGSGNPVDPGDTVVSGESISMPVIDPVLDPSLASALYLIVVTL